MVPASSNTPVAIVCRVRVELRGTTQLEGLPPISMVTVARRPVCSVTLTPGDPALASVRDLVDASAALADGHDVRRRFRRRTIWKRGFASDKFSTAWGD